MGPGPGPGREGLRGRGESWLPGGLDWEGLRAQEGVVLGRGLGVGWGLAVRVGQGQESSTCSRLPQKARGRGAESGHGDLVPAGVGYPGQGGLGSD